MAPAVLLSAAFTHWGSGTATLFDISNPKKPVQHGSVGAGLASVTAISIDDARMCWLGLRLGRRVASPWSSLSTNFKVSEAP